MELDEAINSRRSIRSFKETKTPPYSRIIDAIVAASKAPSAGNLPALKFILVTDKGKIKELSQAAQQDFIAKAPYIVAVCNDKKLLKKYYYSRSDSYAKQQAGAAIENFLLKVTDMNLACCWIGAFSDETAKRILKIPDDVDIEALLPVGYETEEIKQRKRTAKPEINSLVFFNEYKNKKLKPIWAGEPQ